MDLIGVARTIDHAVYTAFNALAIALWRLDAALLGMSIFGYQTQDWLTGHAGQGIWFLLTKLVGAEGIIGIATWQVFLALALVMYGLSLVIRPFLRIAPVDIGRLMMYAIVAHIFITQGNALMLSAERWRGSAGSAIYQAMADSDVSTLTPPAGNAAHANDDPLAPPADLDGASPLRGWEAVGSSYFLARNDREIHDVIPPHDFRVSYCLYDPREAIDTQDETNTAGCSPRKAWDEWDLVSTGVITNILGIPVNIGIQLPISQEHPENRQLGIRQAQAGAARLALGPIVALFPLLEANVGLMLALAASFIYLSLPVMLLFGFFRATETLVVGLLFQFLNILLRTVILQGLVALFLMVLIGVAAQGSLTAYLGLIGIGLLGGFFLSRMATATLRETMTQTMGSVGRLWTGAAVGAFGESARKPAQKVFGAASLATAGLTAGAVVAGGGIGRVADIAEPTLDVTRGSLRDLKGERAASQVGQPMPDSLAVLAQHGGTGVQDLRQNAQAQKSGQGISHGQSPMAQRSFSPPVKQSSDAKTWTDQWYRAQATGEGQTRVRAEGYAQLGEDLHRRTEPVLRRHSQAESTAVLQATRQVAQKDPQSFLKADGTLSTEKLAAVREKLDTPTRRAFSGTQGERDFATLVAMGAQQNRRAEPAHFRRESAKAKDGFGDQSPGHVIPQKLGLDVAAGGVHQGEMNRFVRLSDQAGLQASQREQLLTEARQGELSPQLRQSIENTVRQNGGKVNPETLIAGARAMPESIEGPRRIRFGHQSAAVAEQRETKAKLRQVGETPPTLPGRTQIQPELIRPLDNTPQSASLARDLRQADGVPHKTIADSLTRIKVPSIISAPDTPPTTKERDPLPAGNTPRVVPLFVDNTTAPAAKPAVTNITPPDHKNIVDVPDTKKPEIAAQDDDAPQPAGRAVFSVDDAPPTQTKITPPEKSDLVKDIEDTANTSDDESSKKDEADETI